MTADDRAAGPKTDRPGDASTTRIPEQPDTQWQRSSGARPSTRQGRPVGRITTVIAEQPWFRYGTPANRRLIVQAVLDARKRAHDRRERVKAHPDLVARLCRSLGYSRFDQWSGFVPPTRMPGAGDNDWLLNTSPVRDELIAILHLVVEREKAAAEKGVAPINTPADSLEHNG